LAIIDGEESKVCIRKSIVFWRNCVLRRGLPIFTDAVRRLDADVGIPEIDVGSKRLEGMKSDAQSLSCRRFHKVIKGGGK